MQIWSLYSDQIVVFDWELFEEADAAAAATVAAAAEVAVFGSV